MPISSPRPESRSARLLRPNPALVLACLFLAVAPFASAQMLARPGMPGLNAEAWWKHAVFYQVSGPANAANFKALAARLDALRSLGVDALLLPAPALPPPGSGGAMPDLDDLDNLLRQAGSRGMRVVLTIQAPGSTADLTGLARFWLTHGVAGLHVITPAGTTPEQTQAIVQTLRKLEAASAGQRIVISDQDLGPAGSDNAKPTARRTSASRTLRAIESAQLQIDTRAEHLQTLDAASLRPLLEQAIAQPDLLLALHAPGSSQSADPPLADAVAAIAVLSHPDVLIDSRANLALAPTPEHSEPQEPVEPPKPPPPPAQPPAGVYLPFVPYVPPPKPKPVEAAKPAPPDPLTSWYQKLTALHHDNATLRDGGKTYLDFDAQNVIAWVSRPAHLSPQTPPVVVLCNLSSSPVELPLTADMKKLNLRGFYLRSLLRSDKGMGAQDLNAVTLPPFGVYIGELRF